MNRANHRELILCCLMIIFFICIPLNSDAFYEHHHDGQSMDLRGLIRGFGIAYKNPDDAFFYKDERESGLGGLARILMEGKFEEDFSFEFNAYQTFIPSSLVSSLTGLGTPQDVDRSGALEWFSAMTILSGWLSTV